MVIYGVKTMMHAFAQSSTVRKATRIAQNHEAIVRTAVKWLSSWLPVILVTLLIFWFSSRPYTAYFTELEGPSYRLFQTYLQYPAHLIEYTILGLLWMWPLSRSAIHRKRATWLTVGAVVITAFLDESIQWCVPTRHFALRDLCVDSAGGVVAAVASRWIMPAAGQRS